MLLTTPEWILESAVGDSVSGAVNTTPGRQPNGNRLDWDPECLDWSARVTEFTIKLSF